MSDAADRNSAAGDDSLVFADEAADDAAQASHAPWLVLIADDELGVHEVTQLALKGVTFQGRPLKFLSAYSASDARRVIAETPGLALAIVDVVMERDDSGLTLARWIREERGDIRLRIILRTGQPGLFNEEEVMTRYDINDYRTKTELTRSKLFSAVIASLRTVETFDQVLALREEVLRSLALASIGEMVTQIAHDIRNPLSVTDFYLSVLKGAAEVQKAPALATAVSKIDNAARNIENLIKHLLRYARSGHDEPVTVSVEEPLKRALEICERTIRNAQVTVAMSSPGAGGYPTVCCQPAQLERVYINLITNACHAMHHQPGAHLLAIRVAEEQDTVTVDFSDNGPGVPQELRERIFQPFFTTKNRTGGSGLGLAICQTITAVHGGQLLLLPREDAGATFRVEVNKNPFA